MSDMNCPYCGAEQDVCHDDGHGYTEGTSHKHKCSQCKKSFVFHTAIHFSYTPQKADCLNGSAHRLEMSKTWPRRFSRMRCKDCDFERTPTAQEFADHGIEVPA